MKKQYIKTVYQKQYIKSNISKAIYRWLLINNINKKWSERRIKPHLHIFLYRFLQSTQCIFDNEPTLKRIYIGFVDELLSSAMTIMFLFG